MTDRMLMSCPNAERCGGTIAFRAWTEDAGEPLHSAPTTVMEDAGKTCRCDLTADQWASLEDAAWAEMCR